MNYPVRFRTVAQSIMKLLSRIKSFFQRGKVFVGCPYDGTMSIREEGRFATFYGFNYFKEGDPKEGQYAVLWQKGLAGDEVGGVTCYKVLSFNRPRDPGDQWFLRGEFYSRTKEEFDSSQGLVKPHSLWRDY